MKIKICKFLPFLCILFFITSCYKNEELTGQIDKKFYVKIDDVALPVRVVGNVNSNVAIVFVHGGPGGTAQTETSLTYWKNLEKLYKVVYWDQRASGYAQGNVKPEDITIERFSKDLDVIVNFTKTIAKAKNIFIHGISWGGALSTYYLSDTTHQKKVKGFIAECPAYDVLNGFQLSKNWVIYRADSLISIGKDVAYWQNAKNFYAASPLGTPTIITQHLGYLNQLKGVLNNGQGVVVQNVSLPDFELDVAQKNAALVSSNLTYNGITFFQMDITNKVSDIKVPLLLIWGEKDGLLPKNNLATKFYNNYGGLDKTYNPAKYQLSAHGPHAEEGAQFYLDIVQFIQSHP